MFVGVSVPIKLQTPKKFVASLQGAADRRSLERHRGAGTPDQRASVLKLKGFGIGLEFLVQVPHGLSNWFFQLLVTIRSARKKELP